MNLTTGQVVSMYQQPDGKLLPTPPQNSQSFSEFINLASNFQSAANVAVNMQDFSNLCSNNPECWTSPTSAMECTSIRGTSLADLSNAWLIIILIVIIAWKIALEMAKLVILLRSLSRGKLIRQQYISDFIRLSPFGPVLYFIGVDWWTEVLLFESTFSDLWWRLIYNSPPQILFLFSSIYFSVQVQQTGLTLLQTISLSMGILSVPVAILKTVHAWCQHRASVQHWVTMEETHNSQGPDRSGVDSSATLPTSGAELELQNVNDKSNTVNLHKRPVSADSNITSPATLNAGIASGAAEFFEKIAA